MLSSFGNAASAQSLSTSQISQDHLQYMVGPRGYSLIGPMAQDGHVYSGLDKHGNQVVIKFIDVDSSDSNSLKYILREVIVMRGLARDPANNYTLRLLDIFFADEEGCSKLFVITEFVEWSLKDLEQADRFDLTDEDIIKIAYGLLSALSYLHSAKIFHRDLRPEHILIDSSLRVKLCGFRLARYCPKEVRDYSCFSRRHLAKMLVKANTRRSTRNRDLSPQVARLEYRAPEVILEEPRYNQKVDLWAAGCILTETLLCSPYFKKKGVRSEQRCLFSGESCLSPSKKGVVSHTQIEQIINVLGQPSDNDLSFISSEEIKYYVATLESERSLPLNFRSLFSEVQRGIGSVIQQLLEFNPYFRPQAVTIMEHSCFNGVRKQLNLATNPIVIEQDLGNCSEMMHRLEKEVCECRVEISLQNKFKSFESQDA